MPLSHLNASFCDWVTDEAAEKLEKLPLRQLVVMGHGMTRKGTKLLYRAFGYPGVRESFGDTSVNKDTGDMEIFDPEDVTVRRWDETVLHKGASYSVKTTLARPEGFTVTNPGESDDDADYW